MCRRTTDDLMREAVYKCNKKREKKEPGMGSQLSLLTRGLWKTRNDDHDDHDDVKFINVN